MSRKSSAPDTIAYRLTEILRRLNTGEKLDPHALVDEFRVNLRTIQRDLNERFAFLELEKKDGLYAANPLRLAWLSIRSPGRLQRVLVIRESNYEDLGDKKQLFEQLKHAAQGCHPITFEYSKAEGAKMVDALPYGLVLQDGIWYLAALNADKLKSYALSKISRLLVASDTFAPDAEIVQKLLEEDSIWLNLQKSEVVLRVAPPAADYFLRQKLIGGQKIVKQLEDGGLIVSGTIAHANQILPIVRQWIPCIHIISPVGLQAELNQQLYAYLGEPA